MKIGKQGFDLTKARAFRVTAGYNGLFKPPATCGLTEIGGESVPVIN